MTTRGALDFLWHTADLNQWRPGMKGKRHSGIVHWYLVQAARQIRASRDIIDDVAVFGFGEMPKGSYVDMARRNEKVLDTRFAHSTAKERRLVLAIGSISGIKETVTGFRVTIDSFAAQRINLTMSGKLLDAMCRSFPVLGRIRTGTPFPGERAIGLFHSRIIRRPKDGWSELEVDAGAIMAASAEWIPVDSSYELAFAHHLVAEDRSFIKPLRYDATTDVLFPDFLLTDSNPAILPVEIWGRDDGDYQARRSVKIDQYRELYPEATLYEWDATKEASPPPLPLKRARGR